MFGAKAYDLDLDLGFKSAAERNEFVTVQFQRATEYQDDHGVSIGNGERCM
jgi:hypothetical protein